jgi:hypothetical protein
MVERTSITTDVASAIDAGEDALTLPDQAIPRSSSVHRAERGECFPTDFRISLGCLTLVAARISHENSACFLIGLQK